MYRILLPTDFSRHAEGAVPLAAALARDHGDAELLLTHVVETGVPGIDEALGVLEPESLMTQMRVLGIQREYGVKTAGEVLYGIPEDQILKLAEAENIDLIVMGTRGKSNVKDLLLGSVTSRVMKAAPCPVMTVRSEPRGLLSRPKPADAGRA